MAYSMEEAVGRARTDLAERLGLPETEIEEPEAYEDEFPNTALGAPVGDEMSGMMMTLGWRILLTTHGETYEYRADRKQIRLYDFKGQNYLI